MVSWQRWFRRSSVNAVICGSLAAQWSGGSEARAESTEIGRVSHRLVSGSETGLSVVSGRSSPEDVISFDEAERVRVRRLLPLQLDVDLVTESGTPGATRVIGRSGREVHSVRLGRHLAQINCLGFVDGLSREQVEVVHQVIPEARVVLAYRPVSRADAGDCRTGVQGPESSRVLYVRSASSVFKIQFEDGFEPVIQRLGRSKI